MVDTLISVPGHGEVNTYISRPEGEGPHPGVMVVHEAFGLNDDIRRIADRFAANGYFTIAPDLICGGRLPCMIRAFRDLSSGGGETIELARAMLRWLAFHDEVDNGRVGVTGFCMGGGFALLLGTEDVAKATAPNYGMVPDDEVIKQLCPVVGSYGGEDKMLLPEVTRLTQTLKEADIRHDVKVYPGAGHSFINNPPKKGVLRRLTETLMGAGYNAPAAEDSWDRILTFFETHV